MIDLLYAETVSVGQIRQRFSEKNAAADAAAAAILDDVRQNGDSAVLAYTKRFDGATLSSLAVTEAEITAAFAAASPALIAALERAAENIRVFHSMQVRKGFSLSGEGGVKMGMRILPLDRVGLYIPGGTASYPSTVLMNVIPAKIAGVPEIMLASPPDASGRIRDAILVAARIAGVHRIFKMGGAQAVAAFAYGTQTVPKADKITGPGNAFVAAAKRQVYGLVDIDMIAGPSEILVIADESANARFVAADLLSQAEHDTMAASILLTTSVSFAKQVQYELALQVSSLPRQAIARQSLADNGRIVITRSLDEAAALCNEIAPEHLELCIADPEALLPAIRHAGSIFLGHFTPEAVGDYIAGPNHTLPTNGAPRFSSPLSVDDFVKKSSYIAYTPEGLRLIAAPLTAIAEAEGFDAHARSVQIRLS